MQTLLPIAEEVAAPLELQGGDSRTNELQKILESQESLLSTVNRLCEEAEAATRRNEETIQKLREEDTAATHTMLGVACARHHQVERALEHLERAVALEPEGFAPRCALGELYMRLCVPEKAREHLALALDHATVPQERAYVQSLLREERARDRRRIYRPSFRQPFWFLRRLRGGA